MTITPGRIVLYVLTLENAHQINRRRTTTDSIADRQRTYVPSAGELMIPVRAWPSGAQAHIGNLAHAGDMLPLLVVRALENGAINGQVFLDGNDQLWVESIVEGFAPGTWHWPPRV